MTRFAAAATIGLLAACTTWRAKPPIEQGLKVSDLACAKTFMVGEPPHPGMPLLPMDAGDIREVSHRIHRYMRDLTEVLEPSEADIIISAIFVPSLPMCTHCDPKPATEWSAIIEKGGSSHRHNYPSGGSYLVLQGRTIFGVDVVGAFSHQVAQLRSSHNCTATRGRRRSSPLVPTAPTSCGLFLGLETGSRTSSARRALFDSVSLNSRRSPAATSRMPKAMPHRDGRIGDFVRSASPSTPEPPAGGSPACTCRPSSSSRASAR